MAKQIPVSTVRVNFKTSPTYSVVPATGAWVTRAVNGHLLCNFLIESEEIPESITLGLAATGQAISEEERSFKNGKERGFINEILAGVMMSPEAAEVIGKKLIEAARKYKSNPNARGFSEASTDN